MLRILPATRSAARAFVARHHSHHRAHVGETLALGGYVGAELVAVVVMGRPSAAALCDGETWEVTRLCVGPAAPRYAASRLLGAAGRAMDACGITLAISYTRIDEPGTCYRAANWTPVALTEGRSWSGTRGRGTAARPAFLPGLHEDSSDVVDRVRWERGPRARARAVAWNGSRWEHDAPRGNEVGFASGG